MSGSDELLVLRLGLIAVIFVFALAVAVSLRSSRGVREPVQRGVPGQKAWRLVVLVPGDGGLVRGARFSLAGMMVLGRDSRAGVVLPDASVSARHASVERVGGEWRVVDLGSTNGTFIDGRRVGDSGAFLRMGQRLALGSVVLQLELE